MKRTLLPFAFFSSLLISQQAAGQKIIQGLCFEAGTGYNIANSSTDLWDPVNKPGINTALLITFKLGEQFKLSSGISYRYLSTSIRNYEPIFACDLLVANEVRQENSWIDHSIQSRFIGIPLRLQWHPFKEDSRWYILAQAEYLRSISENLQYEVFECGARTGITGIPEYDIAGQGFLINLGTGLGYEYTADKDQFYVQCTIFWTSSVATNIFPASGQDYEMSYLVPGLTLGYRFGTS